MGSEIPILKGISVWYYPISSIWIWSDKKATLGNVCVSVNRSDDNYWEKRVRYVPPLLKVAYTTIIPRDYHPSMCHRGVNGCDMQVMGSYSRPPALLIYLLFMNKKK